MVRFLVVVVALAAFAAAASARTVAVPDGNPSLAMTFPEAWKTRPIDYGYSALSPDKDVFVSIEYARGEDDVAAMLRLNEDWMKENAIKPVEPTRDEGKVNGIPFTHLEFDTTDADGKTLVDFFMMSAGKHMAMITVWGSVSERNRHQDDIMAMLNSIRPAAKSKKE